MDVSPSQPSYILVSSFTGQQIRLSKHMKIARCKTALDVIQVVDFKDRKTFPIGTPEEDSSSFNPSAELHANVFAVL